LAEPDQILVSGPVHRNVKNKHGIQSTFIEEKELKNVDEPVKIYKVEVSNDFSQPSITIKKSKNIPNKVIFFTLAVAILLLLVYGLIDYLPSNKPEQNAEIDKSIAVLPFHNLSSDPNLEYMSDGLTDEIINHLFKVKSFDKVVSYSSVHRYRRIHGYDGQRFQ